MSLLEFTAPTVAYNNLPINAFNAWIKSWGGYQEVTGWMGTGTAEDEIKDL